MSLQTIAYVIPYLILTEPRILFTHINILLHKKSINLNIMLQNLKTYNNKQIVQNLSKLHLQICKAILKLQQCLKIQILLIYIKAFQDILAAFYTIMKFNKSTQLFQYIFRGILAIVELFLLIHPLQRTISLVS